MVNNLTILEPFLSKPEEPLHLADISRQTKTPHPTARQHLNALEKQGVLTKSKKGRLTLYKLNFNNPLLIEYIIIAEKLKLISNSENLQLKELISNSENNIVIIFGSAAKDFGKANDIDILTTTPIKKKNKIHIIEVKNLKEVSPALKNEIRKKHIIINGTDKVVRWLYW